jgi:hypothetical protein
MAYLNYIDDDDGLEQIIKSILDIGIERKKEAEKKFTQNVIDPFGSLFEAAAFNVDHKTWKNSETIRQCQKTLQNHVGDLHQKILGKVIGWTDLEKGSVIDLLNEDKKIIAEVKNKYNTVTGGKLADQYYSLDRLVMPKASIYRGHTAYFVTIIPKNPLRFNKPFQPSDKEKGAKCPENELIRIIDGASFYALVTGDENALYDFYTVLPNIIENIFSKCYDQAGFRIPDKAAFSKYFDMAYTKKL